MDANEFIHLGWLGMAQPEGLVVTARALKDAEANITWPVAELQDEVEQLLPPRDPKAAHEHRRLLRLEDFFERVLGWSEADLVPAARQPSRLGVDLDGAQSLIADDAIESIDEPGTYVLLVSNAQGQPLDKASEHDRWSASPYQKFERLLRGAGVPAGLLTNGREFRLVFAPKGESAGHITFRLANLLTTDGRPLLGAFSMLLHRKRLLTVEPGKRLTALLQASREYQNTVSGALREQILFALRELLDGFQRADRVADGRVLSELRRGHLQELYAGLVTVLMRTVFVLYAEEKRLLPMESELYAESYSLTRLHAQLQEDWSRHGDTLDDRFGAWARLVTLFRALHNGIDVPGLHIPARRGDFFSPDKFPFLEGRPPGSHWATFGRPSLPRVSDGVVYRVLDALLVLKGERLQYKGLDVEQIGSVYEGLMGFEVEVAAGASLLLNNLAVVDLEQLLAGEGDRAKRLKEDWGVELKDKGVKLKAAKTVADVHAALASKAEKDAGLIAPGSLYLQAGEERRRTGSHYTPRSLTQPIVETTLRPLLARLGADATAEQILALRVCDPAMGSGAFLVEACRQLADRVLAAWVRAGKLPAIPPDEEPVLHARRLVAMRCLYGVDKNPLAVELARLSLWLVTFAKDHPFTFVDHMLRHGDSLVGLSREQIVGFHWDVAAGTQRGTIELAVKQRVARAEALREQIHAQGDPADTTETARMWKQVNEELDDVRLLGDLVVAAYFGADTPKARAKALADLEPVVATWLQTGTHAADLHARAAQLRAGKQGVPAFHWEIEFPEIFGPGKDGLDCFVGNPPFMGKNGVSASGGEAYIPWL